MELQGLPFVYGTAWKRQQTVQCVAEAIQHGFRAFDTAGQPKHYREDLVGKAIRDAFEEGIIRSRDEIYIQTKFTRPAAQIPSNVPYPLDAPLEEQVHISIETSLNHLLHGDKDPDSSFIDTLLLHSPYPDLSDTLRAWKVFESYVPHRIRALGISNVKLATLEEIYDTVDVKPSFVQLRFHPETQFEVGLRRFCVEKGIRFQAHKVIKGNPELLDSELLGEVTAEIGISRQNALYACILGLPGVQIVNGTKTAAHMSEDMTALETVAKWKREDEGLWEDFMARFKGAIGDI